MSLLSTIPSETHSRNPLKEAVRGLESKLSQIQEVLDHAGPDRGMPQQREDDEVWRWLQGLRGLEEEVRLKLEECQSEITEAEREENHPVVAVKVLYSLPCVRSCIKRLKVQDRILLIIKELSGKIKSGFNIHDVMKFYKLKSTDSEYKPSFTTSKLEVIPVRGQMSQEHYMLWEYFFPTYEKAANKPIICIEGTEGSGKTTLAQIMYNNDRVEDSFGIRKWLCVANSFNKSIDEIRDQMELDVVNADEFSKKRFLLVLDDVHDWGDGDEGFSTCKSLLQSGAAGSIILVTTSTIEHLRRNSSYYVSPLSTSDCWSIVKRAALSGKPQLHMKVLKVGRKFAEKCAGSPLAAKILGNYLKDKATAQEWEAALGDDKWQMELMGMLSKRRYRDFFKAFEKLSPEMKACFSYCAAFPKDTHINVDRLVALWTAMGYFGDADADTPREIQGYGVVESLIHDEILRDLTRSIHKNKITSCKMEEAFYVVAQYECPEFTMIEQQKKLESKAQSLKSFVILSPRQLPEDLFMQLKLVNALVLSFCKLEQLSSEVGSLTLLKFLDVSGNPLKRLPEEIGDLKCLESFYLHSCYLPLSLPERIGDLEHLRHLRINYTTDELHNLPQRFEELTSIRTLDVFRVGGAYDNIGKLKNLNNLVDIRIAVHGEVCFSDADLQSKSKLENLELCFVDKGRDIQGMENCVDELVPPLNLEMLLVENYYGLKLPMWILAESLINKLKRLSLRSAVNISSLPALWKLSSLEFLWICDMPNITHLSCDFFGLQKIQQEPQTRIYDDEYYSDDEDIHSATNWEIAEEGHGQIEESAAAFRSLKTLRFEYLENWVKWEDIDEPNEGLIKVMPSLEELIIVDCPKFQMPGKPLLILSDTPWFKKHYNLSTLRGKEIEIVYYDAELDHVSDQNNDIASTSNSKGQAS